MKEIRWLNKYWFQSSSYVRLDSKPVLLSFGHAGLTNEEWSNVLSELGFAIAYFSQDMRRDAAIGGFDWPVPTIGMQQVDRFLTKCRSWSAAIPAVYPRFHDVYREAGVGGGYPQLPDENGQTLQSTLKRALRSGANIVQIVTWNDWGEGTQIEPSVEFGYRDIEHIRSVCLGQPSRTHATVSGDLRLPYMLLQRRRDASQADEQLLLDEIAVMIATGKLEEARRQLGEPSVTGPRK